MSFTEIRPGEQPTISPLPQGSVSPVPDSSPPPIPDDSPPPPEVLAHDLGQVDEVLKAKMPRMEQLPNPARTLPRGLFRNGRWETNVTLRELNGIDEETIAQYENDPVLFFDAVIALGTKTLGSVNLESVPFEERRLVLGELLVGEKEQLFLGVTEVTFGPRREVTYKCPACESSSDIVIDVSKDFPAKATPDIQELEYHFTTSKGAVLNYRLVTGADQERILAKKGLNSAQLNTEFIAACLTKENGGLIVDIQGTAQSLGMADRSKLIKEMADRQPSPDMDVEFDCPACQRHTTVFVAWNVLFRP